jgi:hypothetical protein
VVAALGCVVATLGVLAAALVDCVSSAVSRALLYTLCPSIYDVSYTYREGCVYMDTPPCNIPTVYICRILQGGAVCVCVCACVCVTETPRVQECGLDDIQFARHGIALLCGKRADPFVCGRPSM